MLFTVIYHGFELPPHQTKPSCGIWVSKQGELSNPFLYEIQVDNVAWRQV
jgi:hypothetical protein